MESQGRASDRVGHLPSLHIHVPGGPSEQHPAGPVWRGLHLPCQVPQARPSRCVTEHKNLCNSSTSCCSAGLNPASILKHRLTASKLCLVQTAAWQRMHISPGSLSNAEMASADGSLSNTPQNAVASRKVARKTGFILAALIYC